MMLATCSQTRAGCACPPTVCVAVLETMSPCRPAMTSMLRSSSPACVTWPSAGANSRPTWREATPNSPTFFEPCTPAATTGPNWPTALVGRAKKPFGSGSAITPHLVPLRMCLRSVSTSASSRLPNVWVSTARRSTLALIKACYARNATDAGAFESFSTTDRSVSADTGRSSSRAILGKVACR